MVGGGEGEGEDRRICVIVSVRVEGVLMKLCILAVQKCIRSVGTPAYNIRPANCFLSKC